MTASRSRSATIPSSRPYRWRRAATSSRLPCRRKLRNHSAQPVAFALHAGCAWMEIGCGGGARSGDADPAGGSGRADRYAANCRYPPRSCGRRNSRIFTCSKPAQAGTPPAPASACASSTSKPRRSALISTAVPTSCAAPISRCTASSRIRNRACCRGTRNGCASCWSRSPRRCTGMRSASASVRCPTNGWTSPTRPDC